MPFSGFVLQYFRKIAICRWQFWYYILEENSLIVTLEAGSIMSWQKYIKNKGVNLGIDKFGESAPYKEVYKHFKLSEEDITNFIQKKLRE